MSDAAAQPALDDRSRERRRAMLALLILVPIPTLGAACWLHWFPDTFGKALYGIAKAVLLILPLVWLLIVERGRLSLSPTKRGGLIVGLASGIVIAIAIFIAFSIVGERIDVEEFKASLFRLGFDNKWFYLGVAAYVIVINAALEEYVWRWFIFRQCERLMPGIIAVVFSALLFTIHHIVALRAYVGWDITLLGCVGLLIGASTWSWLYWRYRSIWPGYLSHILADIAVYIIGWRLLFGA